MWWKQSIETDFGVSVVSFLGIGINTIDLDHGSGNMPGNCIFQRLIGTGMSKSLNS